MGEPTTPASGHAACDAWPAFQAAFIRLVDEAIRKEASSAAPGGRGGASPAEIRKMVADAVGAVLLETPLLEKVIEKHLKGQPSPAAKPGAEGSDAIRQETGKVVREYLSRHLGVLFQTEIRGVIQKEMKTILASDELKELIDEKFRTINSYLKSEVIPKIVQQELSKSSA